MSDKAILVVEDDYDFADILRAFINDLNMKPSVANSVEAGLQLLKSDKEFDLAILDFWIEENSIVPILDVLSSRGTPILIITGGGGHFSIETSKAVSDISGVDAFLRKPFLKKDFQEVLLALLERNKK